MKFGSDQHRSGSHQVPQTRDEYARCLGGGGRAQCQVACWERQPAAGGTGRQAPSPAQVTR